MDNKPLPRSELDTALTASPRSATAPASGSAAAVALAAARLTLSRDRLVARGEEAARAKAERRNRPGWRHYLSSFVAPLLGLGSWRDGFRGAQRHVAGDVGPLAARHPKTLLLVAAAAGGATYLLLPRMWRWMLWPTLLAEGQMLAQRTIRDLLVGGLSTAAAAAVAPSGRPAAPDAAAAASPPTP